MSAGGDSATNFSSQALPGRVLAWALPDGWVEEPGGGGLRIATLRPPGPGKVDISVVALPGTAGGELANVNRWREQIGLPPLKETELNSQRTQVKAPAGSMSVFDMDHSGRAGGRLTVGMIKAGAHTWFIKMTGDRVAVLRTRPSFLSLLKSVRASEGASVEVPA